ncbi:MAG: DUF433 domain-containing protein [Dehalococcoidia bacterium]
MSSATVDIGTLITSTPGVNGGRPCIAGTATSVQRISILYNHFGMTPGEIHEQLPHVELAQIFAALTYYFANRDAIDARIEEDERESARLAEEDRLSKLAG